MNTPPSTQSDVQQRAVSMVLGTAEPCYSTPAPQLAKACDEGALSRHPASHLLRESSRRLRARRAFRRIAAAEASQRADHS
eukprot:scaffold2551_cov376-Prasinococcus_capsulatus_cf.AAC.6